MAPKVESFQVDEDAYRSVQRARRAYSETVAAEFGMVIALREVEMRFRYAEPRPPEGREERAGYAVAEHAALMAQNYITHDSHPPADEKDFDVMLEIVEWLRDRELIRRGERSKHSQTSLSEEAEAEIRLWNDVREGRDPE